MWQLGSPNFAAWLPATDIGQPFPDAAMMLASAV